MAIQVTTSDPDVKQRLLEELAPLDPLGPIEGTHAKFPGVTFLIYFSVRDEATFMATAAKSGGGTIGRI